MTTIITVIITVIACQFVLFLAFLLDKLDDEKVQIILCGVWSIFGLVFLRGGGMIYKKLRLRNFNKKYTRCEFMDTTAEERYKKSVFFVKNTEVVKLNTNTNSTYYIVITSDKKAKSMPDNYKNNRNQSVINDLTNPPIGWDAKYISQYMI